MAKSAPPLNVRSLLNAGHHCVPIEKKKQALLPHGTIAARSNGHIFVQVTELESKEMRCSIILGVHASALSVMRLGS